MRIAITGGVAEGKSTVLGYLAEMGHSVASADRIASDVLASQGIQGAIAALLGLGAPFERAVLLDALQDNATRRAVNSITHPEIVRRLRLETATFFEIPLLVEDCLQAEFDRVWVVTCGLEEQTQRLSARLGNAEKASLLIRTQLATRAKIPFADSLIRTNQDETCVKRCVSVAVQRDLR